MFVDNQTLCCVSAEYSQNNLTRLGLNHAHEIIDGKSQILIIVYVKLVFPKNDQINSDTCSSFVKDNIWTVSRTTANMDVSYLIQKTRNFISN